MNQLISKDSNGKLRLIELDTINNKDGSIIIKRYSGQVGGKITEQPDITITKGKVNRTLQEQCDLEFKSLRKGYLDKGYKLLELPMDNYTIADLHAIVGEFVTNQSGVLKPMLAKQSEKVANKKVFNKEWYISRKIDGLRCLIYMGDDGELHTSSRGGMNYDNSMYEILTNPILKRIFNRYPNLIMDGEIYRAGYDLASINSVARTIVVAKDFEFLQFYWYDIVDTEKTFVDRLDFINEIAAQYDLTYDPYREFKQDELRIQIVPHVLVSGWDNMMKHHNDYVEEGFEGAVIRDPNVVYKPGARGSQMIKIKLYKTEEFLITGYELGLRGSEDMTFVLQTNEGKTFKSKPWGTRERKQWYIDNFEEECLNHYSITKFFYYSADNIPLQPSTIAVRLKEDMPE